jgi:hypothetical protein
MSEQPQRPIENLTSNAATTTKRGISISAWLTGAVFVISLLFNLSDLVKFSNVESIKSVDMFAMPSEILDRYSACDYKFLFFCTLKSEEPEVVPSACQNETGAARVACEWSDTGDATTHWWTGVLSLPYVKIPILAVITLPHLPDAMHHVLKDRWDRSRLDFSVGVFFLFGYLALMIVALRQKSPGNLWYFAIMVVFGPYLVAIVFWLLQHAVGGSAGGVRVAAEAVAGILGPTGCTLIATAEKVEWAGRLFGVGHGGRGHRA